MMPEQEEMVQALGQVANVMTNAITNAMKEEREHSDEMINELKETHKAEKAQMERYLEDAREHIKMLDADKERLRTDKKELSAKVEKLQKDNAEYDSIIKQAKIRLESAAGEKYELRKELDEAHEIIRKLQEENKALRAAKSIRMPSEFNGETEKTKEAKAERARKTRGKILHEIARYCAYPGFNGKVSMSWMIANTGFSDKTIRDCVKNISQQEIQNEGMHTWIIKGCSFKDVK